MPDDNRYIRDLALDIGDDNVPYQPWARRLFDERKDGLHSGEDPDAHCLPQGVPKLGYVSYPWKLVETPSSVVVLYETFTFWRQIFTDGRTVDPTAKPAWMGYSTGRWEGDTLVVTTTGFNGKSWLDQLGRPTTDRLRVTERFTRTHYGHMRIDVTIDDPGAYTAPWSASQVVHCGLDGSRSSSFATRTTRTSRTCPATRGGGTYEHRGGAAEGISRVGSRASDEPISRTGRYGRGVESASTIRRGMRSGSCWEVPMVSPRSPPGAEAIAAALLALLRKRRRRRARPPRSPTHRRASSSSKRFKKSSHAKARTSLRCSSR